jgi:hypothetical protein
MPQGGEANRDAQPILTSLLQFNQRQVRLGFNPASQHLIVIRQPGAPITAHLLGEALSCVTVLLPKPLDTSTADTKSLANLTGAFAPFARSNNSFPQILAQWTHR